ncbi:GrpB family protein [Streptomyces sp. NPDC041068]|uniref:GrpB family protein n=1 Tax=Streptomyces sp. NPDC041068 TaxID=3155130 RepID=UPI0034076B77
MIVVSDHSPHWAAQFRELRDRLAPHVADIAVAVEHVGSTSVPGCAAKPIIELDIVVACPSAMPELVARLTGQGYRHEGDLGIAGREAFRAPEAPIPHHLYGVVEGSKPHLDHVLLRDYLRLHLEEVRRYSELKRTLARRFTGDREGRAAYLAAKSGLVEELLGKAYRAARPPSTTG